mmetsp:Transcript_11070/g.34103  ORF Transcript_11070/g.34103 Transcript_11070/m.34103 type:complete len:207 (-) Transcript_11070:492-1112(-)
MSARERPRWRPMSAPQSSRARAPRRRGRRSARRARCPAAAATSSLRRIRPSRGDAAVRARAATPQSERARTATPQCARRGSARARFSPRRHARLSFCYAAEKSNASTAESRLGSACVAAHRSLMLRHTRQNCTERCSCAADLKRKKNAAADDVGRDAGPAQIAQPCQQRHPGLSDCVVVRAGVRGRLHGRRGRAARRGRRYARLVA